MSQALQRVFLAQGASCMGQRRDRRRQAGITVAENERCARGIASVIIEEIWRTYGGVQGNRWNIS